MLVIPLLVLILIIGALADVITGDGRIKHLDKMTWIFIIVFLPLIGSVLWFIIGHDYGAAPVVLGSVGDPRRAPAPMSNTEQQLAALEREIEAHEKAARIAALEAQLKAKREAKGGA
jgi:hypothetical protein